MAADTGWRQVPRPMAGLHLVRGNHGSKTDTPPGDAGGREEGHTTKVHRDKAPLVVIGIPIPPPRQSAPRFSNFEGDHLRMAHRSINWGGQSGRVWLRACSCFLFVAVHLTASGWLMAGCRLGGSRGGWVPPLLRSYIDSPSESARHGLMWLIRPAAYVQLRVYPIGSWQAPLSQPYPLFSIPPTIYREELILS